MTSTPPHHAWSPRRLGRRPLGLALVLVLMIAAAVLAAGRGFAAVHAHQQVDELGAQRATVEGFIVVARGAELEAWRNLAHGEPGLSSPVLFELLLTMGQVETFFTDRATSSDPEERRVARRNLSDLEFGRRVSAQLRRGELTSPAAQRRAASLASSRDWFAGYRRWLAVNSRITATRERAAAARAEQAIAAGVSAVGLGLLFALCVGLRLRDRNQHHLERLARMALTDPLTDLPNRRALNQRLEARVAAAAGSGGSFCLAIVDIDHFKRVNDEFGHTIGDQVLRETATRLRRACRRDELVARIGGEEFAILLPGVDGPRARRAADRVRQAIALQPFPRVGRLTASAGVAIHRPGESADALLARADVALYTAKHRGRDLSWVADGAAAVPIERREPRPGQGFEALRTLAEAIDSHRSGGGMRGARIGQIAVRLATGAGWSAQDIERLHQAALVHDAGRIAMPAECRRRADELEPPGTDLALRRHPLVGADLARGVLDGEQVRWIAEHHERWDGSGYPLGLSGDEIALGARLLAIAGAWDAVLVGGPWPDARERRRALRDCRAMSGTRLWPAGVELLAAMGAGGPDEPDRPRASDPQAVAPRTSAWTEAVQPTNRR